MPEFKQPLDVLLQHLVKGSRGPLGGSPGVTPRRAQELAAQSFLWPSMGLYGTEIFGECVCLQCSLSSVTRCKGWAPVQAPANFVFGGCLIPISLVLVPHPGSELSIAHRCP